MLYNCALLLPFAKKKFQENVRVTEQFETNHYPKISIVQRVLYNVYQPKRTLLNRYKIE